MPGRGLSNLELAIQRLLGLRIWGRLETSASSEAVGAKRQRIWAAWRLGEVEVVGEIHRVSVAVRKLPQAPILFYEAKDARELTEVMIDHPAPRVGRDDEQRDADPEPEAVHLRR